MSEFQQMKQKGILYPTGNSGWPEPLVDPSDPIRLKVSIGKNGGAEMNDGNKTSQDIWSLVEGKEPAAGSQPDSDPNKARRHPNPLKTSQMQESGHHLPEGQ